MIEMYAYGFQLFAEEDGILFNLNKGEWVIVQSLKISQWNN
jgi:hypothetical protein